MRKIFFLIVSIGMLSALVFDIGGSRRQLTAQLLPETTSPEQLKTKYQNSTLKILLIPGHTDQSPGAQFQNLREFDLNRKMAEELKRFFQYDSRVTAYTVDDLDKYLKNTGAIEQFLNQTIQTSKKLFAQGTLKRKNDGVKHVRVPYGDALRLYGVNKWANDNGIDLVLHIHFNDHPGHVARQPGKYNGFAIYIPERQLPNNRASDDLAKSVQKQIAQYFPISNHPQEKFGIIEDQDLIAIGAKASLNGAAMLIEYGYIYESHITNAAVQPLALRELAYQTYLGIKKHFEPNLSEAVLDNFTLPYVWKDILREGMKNRPDVFAMQLALTQAGFYPPTGQNKNDCPPSGNFRVCTKRALIAFQKRHGIQETGELDQATRALFGKVAISFENENKIPSDLSRKGIGVR